MANHAIPQHDELDILTRAMTTDWVLPPIGQLADQRWREAAFSAKLANALCWLCCERPIESFDPLTRADFHRYAEEVTESAINDLSSWKVKLDSIRERQQIALGNRDDVPQDMAERSAWADAQEARGNR